MPMSPRLLRPRATGFNPKSIAGLQLWLDAADSSTITTGTGVSEWRDKSATGSKWTQGFGNEQPATGTQSINGKNVLVFDGSNDSLSSVAPLATAMPLSFFLVQRIVSKTSFGMTYTAGTADNLNIRQSGSSGGLNITASGAAIIDLSTGDDRTGINDILSWVVPSSGDSVLRRNGTQLTLSGPALKPVLTGTHYLGTRVNSFYANIYIAEVIAYSTQLTHNQRNDVESYLGKKWGITLA
jgi:hypothetical protein